MAFLRPIRRFVLLVDEQPVTRTVGGIEVPVPLATDRLDYVVAAIGTVERDPGFGVGDTVVLSEPEIGRKLTLDGVRYRLVRVRDIIGVVE